MCNHLQLLHSFHRFHSTDSIHVKLKLDSVLELIAFSESLSVVIHHIHNNRNKIEEAKFLNIVMSVRCPISHGKHNVIIDAIEF